MHRTGVFISHDWRDKEFARKIAADLEVAGARIWIDEAEIAVGEMLIEKIRRGIDEMDYLAVVLSPNSIRSEWVKREIDVAMNQEIEGRRVKVLPLLFRQCELPGFLKGKYYADFTSPEKYEKSFQRLLFSIGLAVASGKVQNPTDVSSVTILPRSHEFNQDRLNELFHAFVEKFDEEELKTLCFSLRIDYDDLPANGKKNKTRELLSLLNRQSRITEIIEIGKTQRPNIDWERFLEQGGKHKNIGR